MLNPTIAFLDDPCSLDRYNKNWSIVRTLNFGAWAFQKNEDGNILYRIEDIDQWVKDKDLHLILPSGGVYNVRNICGTKCKLTEPEKINVDFWVNIILPNKKPIDLREVRFEAYNDRTTAIMDAETERKDNPDIKVFTRNLTTEIETLVSEENA